MCCAKNIFFLMKTFQSTYIKELFLFNLNVCNILYIIVFMQGFDLFHNKRINSNAFSL